MLLDSKHNRWVLGASFAAAVAVIAYVPYHLSSANGPSGGSLPGMLYAIAALGLMAFSILLGVRRKLSSWRIGRADTWLRAHLWLGLLTVPIVLCHSGFRFGGTLTATLMVLLFLVVASGVYGFVLQQFLPRAMMIRVPMETVYEQIDSVLGQLLREADDRVRAITDPSAETKKPQLVAVEEESRLRPFIALDKEEKKKQEIPRPDSTPEGAEKLKELYLARIRPFLQGKDRTGPAAREGEATHFFGQARSFLDPAFLETLSDLEALCKERRQLELQVRLHRWLQGWLLVHVPLSYALLLLVVVHAFVSVAY